MVTWAQCHINELLDCFELQSKFRDEVQLLKDIADDCENDTIANVERAVLNFSRSLKSEISALHEAENIGDHIDVVVELLELPRVMQALVAGQRYEEAIDVQAQLLRLIARPIATQLPILRQVALQIHRSSLPMVSELIAELGATQKLSPCLKFIGYLRRLHAFSETELQILFLRLRLKSFYTRVAKFHGSSPSSTVDDASGGRKKISGMSNTATSEYAADYLKHYLDLARSSIFDTVTQYTAIFQDFVADSDTLQTDKGTERALVDGLLKPTQRTSNLASFMVSFCTNFLATLHEVLPNVTSITVLGSLFTSCMYLGLSVGRLGFDMRSLVVNFFEDQLVALFKQLVQPVYDYSLRVLTDQKAELILQSLSFSSLSSDSSSRVQSFLSTLEKTEGPSNDSSEPPSVLMQCSPLAWILNAFFGAFNQLRNFPIASVHEKLGEYIDVLLEGLESTLNSLRESTNEFSCLELLVQKFLTPSIAYAFQRQLFPKSGEVYLKSFAAKLENTAVERPQEAVIDGDGDGLAD